MGTGMRLGGLTGTWADPYTTLGGCWGMVYGTNFMVHLVLKLLKYQGSNRIRYMTPILWFIWSLSC